MPIRGVVTHLLVSVPMVWAAFSSLVVADSGAAAAVWHSATADAQVDRLADELFDHLQATSAVARLQSGVTVTEFDDLSFAQAQREAAFCQEGLARLDRVPLGVLTHEHWLLARLLRNAFGSGAHSQDDYWLKFAVTPYTGGFYLVGLQNALTAQPVKSTAEREDYLRLLNRYAEILEQVAAKTRAQAARGIRVPKPAIDGVRATFTRMKSGATQVFTVAPERLADASASDRSTFESAVNGQIVNHIVPAYERILALFDEDYMARAPVTVGISQYPGGRESYLRRIDYATGYKLTPQQIHNHGLEVIAGLEDKMKAIRNRVGFKGDRAAFNDLLRKDPRFFASSTEQLELRYHAILQRVEPRLPQYFLHLPRARYVVRRANPAAEAGMSFGYYQDPTPADPVGSYNYNGSNLDQRSLVTASHMIYREVVPGAHILLSLQSENTQSHPVRKLLYFGAFTNGWAEYAVELAQEMGALDDPYDRYGHLLSQAFVATRLVVDTGMNDLGWPLERARQFMRDHTFESDAIIATETLRYSTDYFGQALDYRLGYERMLEARHRAETELGDRFDIRKFHDALIGTGAMPLDSVLEHIDWFIAGERERASPR